MPSLSLTVMNGYARGLNRCVGMREALWSTEQKVLTISTIPWAMWKIYNHKVKEIVTVFEIRIRKLCGCHLGIFLTSGRLEQTKKNQCAECHISRNMNKNCIGMTCFSIFAVIPCDQILLNSLYNGQFCSFKPMCLHCP